MPNW